MKFNATHLRTLAGMMAAVAGLAAQAAGVPAKTGGGAAGFDFTRICWNGAAEGTTTGPNTCTGTLVANTTGTASATPATDWACTQDNVTGLVWSLQTQTANWNTASDASYPDIGHNTPSRCDYSTGWRLPTTRELLSIVHHGLSSGPMVEPPTSPARKTAGTGRQTPTRATRPTRGSSISATAPIDPAR
jgi:hypothetical protein